MNEMSDQLRAIAFVLLALLILFAWSHFYKPPVPPPMPAQTTQQPAPEMGSNQARPGAGVAPASGAANANIPVIRATEEKMVVVESPLYRVEMSNQGGVVRSWKLKKYFDYQTPPHPLDLVNSDSSQQLGWPFSLLLSDAQLEAQANAALYHIEAAPTGPGASSVPVPPDQTQFEAPATVVFHWSDGHLDVTKKLKFENDYVVSVEASAALDGKPLPVAIAWRGGFGDKAVYQASQLVSVFYKQNDKLTLLQYKKLGVPDNQSQPFVQSGPLEYAGLEDQFFTATFIPDGVDLSMWHWMQQHKIVVDDKPATEPEAEMAAGTTAGTSGGKPLRLQAFVGPKDYTILSKVQPPLEELVQFGWTGIIAKPIFDFLKWIYRYVPNYGWAIIILTLIINMATFPLKMKSQRSMQKMAKVAPEMRQIQDRYKKYAFNDPRKKKMNDEIMELYARHGINPMTQLAGCLPMLLQMPIWWALWRVLNGAIELRHAPFLGWIHDLSAKDPYYILPIAMTIAMYLMTKMTPQPAGADPAQQKMMALMPVMMGFIFFRLSSGLNLYMFTSNLVGMGQQWFLNKTEPLPSRSRFKKKTE